MDLALEETAADGVLAVEWPERAWDELPPEHLLVRLEWEDERRRRITFESRGQRYGELVRALKRGMPPGGLRVARGRPA